MPTLRITAKEAEKLIKILSTGKANNNDMETLSALRRDLLEELERSGDQKISVK